MTEKFRIGTILILMLICCMAGTGFSMEEGTADLDRETGDMKIETYLQTHTPSRTVLTPEGAFVVVFNPEVATWVSQPLTKNRLEHIKARLAPDLRIELTPRGFARAADRDTEGGNDDTNYDAVWVRDSVWVYFALQDQPERRFDARRLILALWDYYATDTQRARFNDIIAGPSRAADKMKVPHIRFDGASPTLEDVSVEGRPEVWNHRQNDAHGIFLAALAHAVRNGLVQPEDLTAERFTVLATFPAYFDAIAFETFEDAGAWEEIDRRNTSSIGLVTRGLQAWRDVLFSGTQDGSAGRFSRRFITLLANADVHCAAYWNQPDLEILIGRGMTTVRRQLALGGESPDYAPDDIRFRRADAYLTALIVPSPLGGFSEAEMRQVLGIVETLKRPAGILRYEHDSYQSGNYWIKTRKKAETVTVPTTTGDTSSRRAFLERSRGLIPQSEAQWFFDSLLVLARLHLASVTGDPVQKQQDTHFAAIHLKRALGQLTGSFGDLPALAADSTPVASLLAPESINTVVVDGTPALLPSPIVPLNWAKAALSMALNRFERDVYGK